MATWVGLDPPLPIKCLHLLVATFILYTNTLPPSSTEAYEPQPVSSGPFGEFTNSGRLSSVMRDKSCRNPEGKGKAVGIG